jgi:hypothetical protein
MTVYSLSVRSRAGALVLALVLLGAGVTFFTVGFALIAALAVAGGLLGSAAALYYRLRGGQRGSPQRLGAERSTLDPSLEVFPEKPAMLRPAPTSEQVPKRGDDER